MQLVLMKIFMCDGIYDLIVIDFIVFMVNYNYVIVIVVEGNIEICFFSQYMSLECVNVGSFYFGIDVYIVWFIIDSDNVCFQFVQYVWCDVISCIVCIIYYNFQFIEVKFVWECGFVKFDIVICGINDMVGFIQFC